MKLTKEQIIMSAEISSLDADIRISEFKKFKNLEGNSGNYDYESMKKLFPDANYFDIDCVEGVYGQINDYFFINFRGSDGLLDWVRNFMFSKKVVPYDGTNENIKIHGGFLKDYKKVRDFIHSIVKANTSKKVVIYGHSMGAALSAICALDLQYNFPEKEIGVFVIGMPRIGNDEFKRSFEGRLPDFIRCTFRNDLIPQLPPESFGFVHLNKYYQLGGERTRMIGTKKDHNWHLYLDSLKKEIDEIIKQYEK